MCAKTGNKISFEKPTKQPEMYTVQLQTILLESCIGAQLFAEKHNCRFHIVHIDIFVRICISREVKQNICTNFKSETTSNGNK